MADIVSVVIQLVLPLIVAAVVWFWWNRDPKDGLPPCISMVRMLWINLKRKENYGHVYKTYAELGKKHAGIFAVSAMHIKLIFLTDWKIIRDAFTGQSDIFAGRPDAYMVNVLYGDTDIMFSDGPVWKEKKRFTLCHLRNFGFGKSMLEVAILNEASRMIDVIQRHNGKKILINKFFSVPILNVLLHIISGKTYDHEDDEIKKLSKALHNMIVYSDLATPVNYFPFLRFLPPYKKHVQTTLDTYEIIKQILGDEFQLHLEWQKSRSGSTDEPRDFMDAFLNEINNCQSKPKTIADSYTVDHMIGIAFDLVEAGVGTTVTTMEWALLYMALWPQIQASIHEELDRVIGRERLPAYADHTLMPYLEATILEIHRFSTIGPITVPHRTTTATKLAGFTIPKDAIVIANIWAVHRDPDLWGDPEVFRPERFINAEGKVEKPDYFISFSMGSRKCIGESLVRVELFLFLATLLQRFTFSYASGEPLPSMEVEMMITRRLKEQVYLVAKER